MPQRQQLERIWCIDGHIRANNFPTAERIAEEMQVSKRVIYQDKAFMKLRLGAPIEFDWQKGGWFYTNPTWAMPAMFVTEGELLAFFLSLDVAQRYLGTDFEAPLQSAVNRLAANLGQQVQINLEKLRDNYTFVAPATPHVDAHLLAEMTRAIRDRFQVRMRYYTASRDEWTERVVNPHHLYNIQGDWYLFAYDHNRQEMRSFHLGRLEWWKILEAHFERVENFSAREWMKTAFQVIRGGEPQQVAIRLDAFQARWIRERRWHESQSPLEETPDGGVILRFQTGSLSEVQRWVMQFGSHAEVLEPAQLRDATCQEVHKMLGVYTRGD
jgi:predicted DNA-binding transcriptional regulator YafY